ncbi:MAG: MoaD/ThiS family protein [Anaerolineae bacterium]
MITVQAKLFATLRQYKPGIGIGEPFSVDLPDGSTVRDLVRQLQLPEDQVKLMFINARSAELDHPLADGDEVGIFPPVGGG